MSPRLALPLALALAAACTAPPPAQPEPTGGQSRAPAAVAGVHPGPGGDEAEERFVVLLELPVRVELEAKLEEQEVVAQRARIRVAQLEALAFLDREPDETVTLYDTLPYVALLVDEREFAELQLRLGPPGGAMMRAMDEDARVPIGLERASELEPQSAAAAPPAAAALPETVALVGAAGLHRRGVTGRGQTVVVIDRGVDPGHPFLAGRVAAGSAVGLGVHGACWDGPATAARRGPPERGRPAPAAPGVLAHGTGVACVAVGGQGEWVGVAPGAEVVSIHAGGRRGRVDTSAVLAALEEVACHWRPGRSIAAVCLSLGEGRYTADCDEATSEARAMALAVRQLAAWGIPVVCAGGNTGPELGVRMFPACLSGTFAVAATERDGKDPMPSSSWSERHDVAAPARWIRIPDPDGGSEPVALDPGTSTAAPFVAGALALLAERHGRRAPEELRRALAASGCRVEQGRVEIPFLRVDQASAWLARKGGSGEVDGSAIGPHGPVDAAGPGDAGPR